MKSFIVALACLSASFASAQEPKVGDQAAFEGTVFYADGSDTPLAITYEVTAINGESATIQVTRQQMAETSKVDQVVDVSELRVYSAEELKEGCEQVGGKFESISVKAGTFDACTQSAEIEGNSFTVSVGPVPFGLLKQDFQEENVKTSLELSSFKYGQ